MPKKFASGATKPDSIYVGNQTESAVFWCTCWRCVPLFFRARGSHAANIQADADLHTFSSHHRDAVPAMRRADAAGSDRATRPQLQPADISLCALRLRRELFEGDVNRRRPAPQRCQRVKAPLEKTGYLNGCRVENPGSRNLPRDQKCHDHGRHGDQSQELIHRKHGYPPARQLPSLSRAAVQLVLCADGWLLVRIMSDITAPEMVSSARIEMTASVLMG
jgi:hypothetical protein